MLTLMSVSCNMIGNDGAITIANSLLPSSKLLELNLEGNRFGYAGAQALIKAADRMSNGFRLTFQSCYIMGAERTKLQELSLKVEINEERSVDMFKNISLSHPEPIERAIQCSRNMWIFNLSNRRLCKSGPEALGRSIKKCRLLQVLVLSNLDLKTTNVLFREIRFCSDLRILDLSFNSISKEAIEDSVEGLKLCIHLKEINLYSNCIGNEGVECLAYHLKDISLEIVNLSCNKVTADGAAALARWLRIGKRLYKYQPDTLCSKYKTIGTFLNHNLNKHVERNGHDGKFYARQGHKWHNSLVELNLSGNEIKCEGAAALSYGLKYCSKLEMLYLQGNEIKQDGCEFLLEGLKECTLLKPLEIDYTGEEFWKAEKLIIYLHELSLSNAKMNELTEVEALNLIQKLSSCTELMVLNLENNQIGIREARALQQAMKSLTKLEEVRIENLGRNSGIIMKGISNSHKIKQLHLQNNILDLWCFKLLGKSVKHDQLVDLKLSQVRLHKVQGAHFLSQGLTRCPKLRFLDLSDNELDSSDIQTLSNGIAICRELIELDLSINKIDSDGAKHLAEGIKSFSNLRWISLSKNEIDSNGVTALMKALRHCIEMKRLHFHHNKIGPDGAAIIVQWIRSTSARRPEQISGLSVLNLAKNNIKVEGAKAIACALILCKKIDFLDLSHNNINSEALESLATGLKHCTHLHTLFLSNNKFGETAALLGEGLKYCHSLKTLSLSNNKIKDDKTLTDCVNYNRRLHTLYIDEHLYDNYIVAFEHILPHCNLLVDDSTRTRTE